MLNQNFVDHVNSKFSPSKQITLQDFVILQQIGKGSYSIVYKVEKIDSGCFYAMKQIAKSIFDSNEQKLSLEQCIKTWASFQHPNIIELYAILEDHQNYYLITEFAEKGNLYNHLKQKKYFSEKKTAKYMSDIVKGVQYLHNLNPTVVHRDLKLENILICKTGLKICDFDQSKILLDYRSTFCGTPDYLSPEMILKIGHNEKIDIWALGIIFYEMLHGKAPFTPDINQGQFEGQKNLENNVLSGYIQINSNLSNEAKNLIYNLLRTNPQQRLSANDILEHEFFQKFKYQQNNKNINSSKQKYHQAQIHLNQAQINNISLQEIIEKQQKMIIQKDQLIEKLQKELQNQINDSRIQNTKNLIQSKIVLDCNKYKNSNIAFLANKTNKFFEKISNFFQDHFSKQDYRNTLSHSYENTISQMKMTFDNFNTNVFYQKKQYTNQPMQRSHTHMQFYPQQTQTSVRNFHQRRHSKNYNNINNYYNGSVRNDYCDNFMYNSYQN